MGRGDDGGYGEPYRDGPGPWAGTIIMALWESGVVHRHAPMVPLGSRTAPRRPFMWEALRVSGVRDCGLPSPRDASTANTCAAAAAPVCLILRHNSVYDLPQQCASHGQWAEARRTACGVEEAPRLRGAEAPRSPSLAQAQPPRTLLNDDAREKNFEKEGMLRYMAT
jgi:hypothetical protein